MLGKGIGRVDVVVDNLGSGIRKIIYLIDNIQSQVGVLGNLLHGAGHLLHCLGNAGGLLVLGLDCRGGILSNGLIGVSRPFEPL